MQLIEYEEFQPQEVNIKKLSFNEASEEPLPKQKSSKSLTRDKSDPNQAWWSQTQLNEATLQRTGKGQGTSDKAPTSESECSQVQKKRVFTKNRGSLNNAADVNVTFFRKTADVPSPDQCQQGPGSIGPGNAANREQKKKGESLLSKNNAQKSSAKSVAANAKWQQLQ